MQFISRHFVHLKSQIRMYVLIFISILRLRYTRLKKTYFILIFSLQVIQKSITFK